jgi:hypothetical protein
VLVFPPVRTIMTATTGSVYSDRHCFFSSRSVDDELESVCVMSMLKCLWLFFDRVLRWWLVGGLGLGFAVAPLSSVYTYCLYHCSLTSTCQYMI